MGGIFSKKFWEKQVADDLLGFNPPKQNQAPHNPVNTNTDNSAAEDTTRQQQETLLREQQEQFQAGQKSHVDSLFEEKINEESLQENQAPSMSGQSGDIFAEASL